MREYFAFKDPIWFAAVIVIASVAILRLVKPQRVWIVPFSSRWQQPSRGRMLDALVVAATAASLGLLIAALARPQVLTERTVFADEPHDIMIAIDTSRSMLSEDYEAGDGSRPLNRLEVLKPVVVDFVTSRPADRIGIVVFSGKAFTLMPPTLNHARLLWSFSRLDIVRFPPGTAIGDGLVLALDHFTREASIGSSAKRRCFVVLMSDGSNNAGLFSVDEALAMARKIETRIYTIAVGTGGYTRVPYMDEQGELQYEVANGDIDEGTLWTIANETGGLFFRATNAEATHASLGAIARRQTQKVMRRKIVSSEERFIWLMAPAIGFALLAAGLSQLSLARWNGWVNWWMSVMNATLRAFHSPDRSLMKSSIEYRAQSRHRRFF